MADSDTNTLAQYNCCNKTFCLSLPFCGAPNGISLEAYLLSHVANKRHDIEHIGPQLNDTQHKGLILDTQHK